MVEFDKLNDYYFDLDKIKLVTENDLKINWFFIKNLYIAELQKDRRSIIVNSLLNKKILIQSDHVVIYRPEYFALHLEELNIANLNSNNTHLEAYLTALAEIYIGSPIPLNDIRMKWLINTLVRFKILSNVFDPANRTTHDFKELFEIE